MLRLYLAQNSFGLSDGGIEDALSESPIIGCLVGIDLRREAAPDATSTLFCWLLERRQLTVRSSVASVRILPSVAYSCARVRAVSVLVGMSKVSLGFGMQKIASNYVSGFIILLDHSIRIGDLIQVNDARGEVKAITTRYTVLAAQDGSHAIVPNETLVGGTVRNERFADPRMRVSLQLQVGYSSDVEAALAILEEIAQAQARVIAEPEPQALVVAFDDSGIRLELAVWISDPENGAQSLKSAIFREILVRFKAAGIEIPFPQREVRLLG